LRTTWLPTYQALAREQQAIPCKNYSYHTWSNGKWPQSRLMSPYIYFLLLSLDVNGISHLHLQKENNGKKVLIFFAPNFVFVSS